LNGTASLQGLSASNPQTGTKRTNLHEAALALAPASSRKSMEMVMVTAVFLALHLSKVIDSNFKLPGGSSPGQDGTSPGI
jgi:hypothetical protein